LRLADKLTTARNPSPSPVSVSVADCFAYRELQKQVMIALDNKKPPKKTQTAEA
jgi:hypothetical protein